MSDWQLKNHGPGFGDRPVNKGEHGNDTRGYSRGRLEDATARIASNEAVNKSGLGSNRKGEIENVKDAINQNAH